MQLLTIPRRRFDTGRGEPCNRFQNRATSRQRSAHSAERARRRMTVWRLVFSSRAIAATDHPSTSLARPSASCLSLSARGRPSTFPASRARARPAAVRSSSRSRSNSATADSTDMVIFPAALVRSAPPSARQCTRTPIVVSSSTVARTSIALRPSRSSFVTTSTSPVSNRSSSFEKPARCFAATEPDTHSETTRRGSMLNPAERTSKTWFSVV
ncbi:hypothetical protein BBU_5654 [Burkholderia pseudomallei NAU35A-3]|nr:hypothetical protein BBU_5654 [Burkholderia pseudomallei NAU35A-3]